MYKKYITSLKGIACLFVAFGHFSGIVKYAQSIPIEAGIFAFLDRVHAAFLLNESFWLQLFFITSGYLLAHSAIRSWKVLVCKCITRFLRLAFPVFFAYCVIFVLAHSVGFHNTETSTLFLNEWYQSFYPSEFGISALLTSPIDVLIFSKCTFNSPYWVLRMMLLGSVIIYALSYIHNKFSNLVFRLLMDALVLVLTYTHLEIASYCVMGALLFYYEKELLPIFKNIYIDIVFLLCSLALYPRSVSLSATLFFSIALLSIPQTVHVRKFFDNSCLDFVGKISFGIYSFHWPLFCSLGALILIKCWSSLGPCPAYWLAISVVLSATVVVSLAFYYTAEKISSAAVQKISHALQTVLGA